MPFFDLKDVSVTGNGSSEILEGVTLALGAEGRYAVVGRSGAGKSTLLRLLNRMVEPSRGSISLEGRSLSEMPPAEIRRAVGMVFQEPTWLPGNARDNLLAAVSLKLVPETEGKKRLEELLPRIGLAPDLLERKEDALSVGQRHRVALGRALMTRPRALLLDEPTSALDPPGAKALLRQVMELADTESLTVVLVTHRLEDARLFARETAVIADRTIREMGPTAEVLSRLEDRWNESDA